MAEKNEAGLGPAIEVFRRSWSDLSCAIDRENAAWEAYEKAGLGNITLGMVKERQDATRAVDRLLRDLANKAWCAERFTISA